MENKNQKKKSGGGLGFLVIIVLMILSGLSEGLDGEIAVYVAFVAVIVVVLWLVRKLGTLRSSAKKDSAAASGHSMKRHEPKVEIHRDFPEPEAHCVVCENTGVDHFDRDRQMRLQQLDDWLKNGLIEREEYAVLKRKFEQS